MIGTWRRALAAAHQLGELEAVHVRHLHVEKRQRDVVHQQQLERFGAGARLEQLHVVAVEQRRQRDEVLLEVVDEQALHDRARHGGSAAIGRRSQGPQEVGDLFEGQHQVHGASLQGRLYHERRVSGVGAAARR